MARIAIGIETDAPGNYQSKLNNREKKVVEAVRLDRNIAISSPLNPIIISNRDSLGLAIPTEAAQGAEIPMLINGKHFEQHLAVVESTGTALYAMPVNTAAGISIPLIAANAQDGIQGAEITNGILANGVQTHTVGSLLAGKKVFIEVGLTIVDISDLGQLFVGFRKAEAYQADPDSYDELAAMHVGETGATVADGQINIATILNNASTTYTDTTLTDWADAGAHTLRVEVLDTGRVAFLYDGAEPTVVPAFSFDSGEVIIPFLYYETVGASSNGDPGIVITSYEAGIV